MPLVVNGRSVKHIDAAPIPQGTSTARTDERTVNGKELTGGGVDAEHFTAPESSVVPEIPENDDPTRRRVVDPKHLPRWARVLRRLSVKRELTADEQAAKSEMQARKALEEAMRADADTIKRRIINNLNAMNLCYRYPKSQRDLLTGNFLGIQEVQFEAVLLMPDVVQLKVQTPLPRGCDFIRMADTSTLTTLSISLQRQVYAKYNENIGFWYIVPRSGSVMGIPGFVKYSEMMEKIPSTADKLTIPLGVTLNSRKVYKSISSMPHLLVSGATGTGKSNEGNVILATLIQRNTPEDLRMILVDLKGGMELSFYEGLPHLLNNIPVKRENETVILSETGIIDDRKDVPDVLDFLITESERRMKLLRDAGYKEIGKYNARRKRGALKLPRLLFFIDEYADVKLAPKIGSLVEDKLANLAARSRAVGIHIVICTQSPKKEVIGTLIKTNLPAKMAFSMPSNTASILILDNGDAKGLSPAGRMIYQNGNEQLTIQTPFMPDEALKRIVAENIAHAGTLSSNENSDRDVTETEILAYSLEYLNGSLNVQKLYAKFKERISQHDLQAWIKTFDGKEYEVNGAMYTIELKPGTIGRVIVPLVEE